LFLGYGRLRIPRSAEGRRHALTFARNCDERPPRAAAKQHVEVVDRPHQTLVEADPRLPAEPLVRKGDVRAAPEGIVGLRRAPYDLRARETTRPSSGCMRGPYVVKI